MSALKSRLKASAIHLVLSAAVALLAAALVFGVWYPFPYRELSGGRELFLIIVAVDVVLGPLLTLTVFNASKPRRELRRDLAVVGILQFAGLAYGLWTVAVARPVHLAFEIDRFRVVHAVDVPEELLDRAPPELRNLPWTGPTLVAVRPFRDSSESADATIAALQGLHLGARPDLWEPYESARPRLLQMAQPLESLRQRLPAAAGVIDAAVAGTGRPLNALVYLPLVGRKQFWTVILDRSDGRVLRFVALDPYG